MAKIKMGNGWAWQWSGALHAKGPDIFEERKRGDNKSISDGGEKISHHFIHDYLGSLSSCDVIIQEQMPVISLGYLLLVCLHSQVGEQNQNYKFWFPEFLLSTFLPWDHADRYIFWLKIHLRQWGLSNWVIFSCVSPNGLLSWGRSLFKCFP